MLQHRKNQVMPQGLLKMQGKNRKERGDRTIKTCQGLTGMLHLRWAMKNSTISTWRISIFSIQPTFVGHLLHVGLGTWDTKINQTRCLPSRVCRRWGWSGERKIKVGPWAQQVHSMYSWEMFAVESGTVFGRGRKRTLGKEREPKQKHG